MLDPASAVGLDPEEKGRGPPLGAKAEWGTRVPRNGDVGGALLNLPEAPGESRHSVCKCVCVAGQKKVLSERGPLGIVELQKRGRISNLLSYFLSKCQPP